jgi:hypothetical protein
MDYVIPARRQSGHRIASEFSHVIQMKKQRDRLKFLGFDGQSFFDFLRHDNFGILYSENKATNNRGIDDRIRVARKIRTFDLGAPEVVCGVHSKRLVYFVNKSHLSCNDKCLIVIVKQIQPELLLQDLHRHKEFFFLNHNIRI